MLEVQAGARQMTTRVPEHRNEVPSVPGVS